MEKIFSSLATLVILFIFSTDAIATDIYAEYKMTGLGKTYISKMFSKNGNIRTEVNMAIGNKQMTTTSLMLKSKPDVTITFNSMSSTYTETKKSAEAIVKSLSIKLLGNEKIGIYNCSHVRMSADGQSWDMWFTKDLPAMNVPINGSSSVNNEKYISALKNKGISGMLVKTVFLKPGTTIATMTMQLSKYETKTLAAGLFSIPAGYKKSNANFDPQKMKNMTTEEKKKMIFEMMKEQNKN